MTPAVADVRRAVRVCLAAAFPASPAENEGESREKRPPHSESVKNTSNSFVFGEGERRDEQQQRGRPLVIVALSGGADSLALAAATAFEAPRAGVRAGAPAR